MNHPTVTRLMFATVLALAASHAVAADPAPSKTEAASPLAAARAQP